MEKVKFIFVGRISHEKGVHLIFEAAKQLVDRGYTNFIIDFVGSGVLVDELITHPLFGTHLFYHGRLPKDQTITQMRSAQYTLMPSLFLETFGLVALDSLACGIPVIGEKKGGLIPFIIDETLVVKKETSLFACMEYVLEHTSHKHLQLLQKNSLYVASGYTPHKRVDNFGQLSNNCKSCLLISDYAKDIGGIENFLFQVQGLLINHGVSSDFFGKTKRVAGWWRKIDLFVAGLNVSATRGLYKKVSSDQFDLVWLHSVQRRFGRLSLAIMGICKKQQVWCMYHDFGLLHPFPSSVYELDQLDHAQSFAGYLQEGKSHLGTTKRYLGGRLLVGAKYVYSAWMFYRLNKVVDVHLLPSAYLLPYLQKKLPISATIKQFPHFVSHAHDV